MRKKLLTLALLLLVLLAGLIAFLSGAALSRPSVIPLDRSPRLVALARYAPAEAEQLILVHSVASLYRTLRNGEVTANAIAQLRDEPTLHLASLLLGNSEAVVWFEGDQLRAVVDAPPLRRWLAATLATVAGAPLTSHDELLFYGDGTRTTTIAPPELTTLGTALPGSLFLYDRSSKRGSFPPIGRPSLTAVEARADSFRIHARAAAALTPASPPSPSSPFELPSGAILSVLFHGDSSALGDFDRLFPLNLEPLSAEGLLLSLYSFDAAGRLLPRPRGVVVLPESDATRQAVASLFNSTMIPGIDAAATSRQIGAIKVDRIVRLGATLEVARDRGRIVLALDDKSLDRYFAEPRETLSAAAGESWVVKADPQRLAPLVEELAEADTLRLLAPKIVRRARDARRILKMLGEAKSIRGVRRSNGAWEEIELTAALEK